MFQGKYDASAFFSLAGLQSEQHLNFAVQNAVTMKERQARSNLAQHRLSSSEPSPRASTGG